MKLVDYIPFPTFGTLYQMIQNKDNLGSESIQVYANKRQVNFLDDQGLSFMNIVFYPEEGRVSVFHCEKHGYCDYNNPRDFTFDSNLFMACSDVIGN